MSTDPPCKGEDHNDYIAMFSSFPVHYQIQVILGCIFSYLNPQVFNINASYLTQIHSFSLRLSKYKHNPLSTLLLRTHKKRNLTLRELHHKI